MKYELKELNTNEIFSTAFNLYLDNFVPLFLIAVVSGLPGFLYSQYNMHRVLSGEAMGPSFGMLITLLVTTVGYTLGTGLTIELVSKKFLGKSQTMGEYISNITPFLLPIVGLAILEGLVVGLGFLLLIIPGVVLYMGLSLSSQVLIIERSGVVDSMKRSWELAKGHKGEIFGFLFVMGLITFAISAVLKFVLMPMLDLGNIQSNLMAHGIVDYLFSAVINPMASCLLILIYFNLRIKKEGFGLEHMVDQFSQASTEPSIEA